MTERTPPQPPPSHGQYVDGESDDLRASLEAFEARSTALTDLAGGVEALADEVRGLRVAVTTRPPRHEVDRKRRKTAAALAIYAVGVIWLHDAHVEHCGPGSRAEAVIRAVAETDPTRQQPLGLERIQDIVNDSQPSRVCDATFPFHAHDDQRYPTGAALVGVAAYGVAAAALLAWAYRPGRRLTTAEREAAP